MPLDSIKFFLFGTVARGVIGVALEVKEPTCQCRRLREDWFDPWVGEDPPEKSMAALPVLFSSWKSHSEGAWRATVHKV